MKYSILNLHVALMFMGNLTMKTFEPYLTDCGEQFLKEHSKQCNSVLV